MKHRCESKTKHEYVDYCGNMTDDEIQNTLKTEYFKDKEKCNNVLWKWFRIATYQEAQKRGIPIA